MELDFQVIEAYDMPVKWTEEVYFEVKFKDDEGLINEYILLLVRRSLRLSLGTTASVGLKDGKYHWESDNDVTFVLTEPKGTIEVMAFSASKEFVGTAHFDIRLGGIACYR